MPRPRDYAELVNLAKALARKSGGKHSEIFDCPSVGLVLREEAGPHASDKSPKNSDCFALSSGAHFSFLQVPGRAPEKAPVVMTVPLGEESANVIVGADFREFLSLGSKSGYAVLGQLGHSEKAGLNAIVRGLLKSEDRRPDLRAAIVDRFGLKPWTRMAERLGELRTEFGALIQLKA